MRGFDCALGGLVPVLPCHGDRAGGGDRAVSPPWGQSPSVGLVLAPTPKGAALRDRWSVLGGGTAWHQCQECHRRCVAPSVTRRHCMAPGVRRGVAVTAWPPRCRVLSPSLHGPARAGSRTAPRHCAASPCLPAPWGVTRRHRHRAVLRVSLSRRGHGVPHSVTAAPMGCHTESPSVPGAGDVTLRYVTAWPTGVTQRHRHCRPAVYHTASLSLHGPRASPRVAVTAWPTGCHSVTAQLRISPTATPLHIPWAVTSVTARPWGALCPVPVPASPGDSLGTGQCPRDRLPKGTGGGRSPANTGQCVTSVPVPWDDESPRGHRVHVPRGQRCGGQELRSSGLKPAAAPTPLFPAPPGGHVPVVPEPVPSAHPIPSPAARPAVIFHQSPAVPINQALIKCRCWQPLIAKQWECGGPAVPAACVTRGGATWPGWGLPGGRGAPTSPPSHDGVTPQDEGQCRARGWVCCHVPVPGLSQLAS